MINLGLRAHDFLINDNVDELATKIEEVGVHYIQFANNISLKKLTNNGEKINAGLGLQVKNILRNHQIEVGVLSCYYNVIHPDKQIQAAGLKQFKHFLEVAPAYGASIVATEPGSVDPAFRPTTENYAEKVVEEAIGKIKEMTAVAERVGISVGIEAGVNHPIHSLDTIKQMFEEIDSPALKLILDPINLVDGGRKEQPYELLEKGLQLFSDKIYAFHVKDYIFENQKEIVRPGDGWIDFSRFFGIIEKYQPGALVILDEAPREGLEDSIELIKKMR